MSKWRDEVEAAVDPVVLDILSIQPALIPEVLLKLLINVVCDWLPARTHKIMTKVTFIYGAPFKVNYISEEDRCRKSIFLLFH